MNNCTVQNVAFLCVCAGRSPLCDATCATRMHAPQVCGERGRVVWSIVLVFFYSALPKNSLFLCTCVTYCSERRDMRITGMWGRGLGGMVDCTCVSQLCTTKMPHSSVYVCDLFLCVTRRTHRSGKEGWVVWWIVLVLLYSALPT